MVIKKIPEESVGEDDVTPKKSSRTPPEDGSLALESERRRKAMADLQEVNRQRDFWRSLATKKTTTQEEVGEKSPGHDDPGRQLWRDIKKKDAAKKKQIEDARDACFYDPHAQVELDKCIKHRESCMVRYDNTAPSVTVQPENCICCGQGIHTGQIPVCVSSSDPTHKKTFRDNVGPGSCLYFEL